jgi:hypothetical protein
MTLRPPIPSRRPPAWCLALLAGLALALLSLGRAPNDATAANNYASTLYLSSTASAIVTGSWTLVTTQPASANTTTQNRMPLTTTGYQDFQPGFAPATGTANTPTPASPASTTPNNKGWLVDGSGAVIFAAGTWTFTATVTDNATATNPAPWATLAVGMWKVTAAANAVSSSTLLVDPNCTTAPCASGAAPGDASPGTDLITTAGSVTVSLPVALGSIPLASGEHLYVQYWRHQSATFCGLPVACAVSGTNASASTRLAKLSVNDGFAKITHPTANGYPDVPTNLVGPVPARTKSRTPTLSAKFSDPDASDTGTLSFQLCSSSDSGCAAPVQSGSSSSGLANGATTGNWTPSSLADGTYYWNVQATDSSSFASVSGWSSTGSFVVDNVAPTTPALGAVASRVNATPQLSATFSDPDASDTGALSFQLCSDANMTANCQSGSSASGLANNASGTWTPSALSNGTTYYWQARAQDLATNTSAWSAAGSFTFDTTPPNAPTLGSPADGVRISSSQLTATYTEPDVGDTGTVLFQLCTNASCSAVAASSTSAVVANNTSVSWTPSVADGVYYWRAQAQDVATNTSASWSATRTFTLDKTVPSVPTLGAVASRVKTTPQLSATFTDTGIADLDTLSFQLCASSACSTVLQSGSASGLASGATGNWTPSALSPGLYYWRAQAQDLAANTSAWSAAGSFTIDTTAPNVPALGTVASRVNAPPQLSATLSDAEAADTGTLSFQLCTSSGCGTVLQSGTSSVVANGAAGTWTPGALADGVYYWRSCAQDIATNTSAWSAARTFTIDTVLPTVPALAAPADGALLGSLPSLTATFADADAGDSGSLSFQVCSDLACSTVVAAGASATVANGGSGSWQASALADGAYYARVRSQDVAGNVSAWSSPALSFHLDTGPPGVPVLDGIVAGTRTAHLPTLSATFSDPGGAGAGTVTFQVCANASCSSVVASTAATGVANGTAARWTPTLSDGAYHWRARAQDATGNQSAWSPTVAFVLDTTPPPVPVLLTPDGVHSQSAPVLTARLDTSDPADGPRLGVEVCTDPGCALVLTSAYASGTGADVGWQWLQPLSDGVYYWRATAEDAAGNQSVWSGTRSFVVDHVAPDVPASASPGADVLVARAQLSAAFHSSDPSDSGTLSFRVCTDEACSTVAASGSSAGVGPGGTGRWTATGLPDGSYFWQARAVDAAGNASAWSSAQSFTLDTTPPAKVREFKAALAGTALTLRWQAPADGSAAGGYVLFVGNVRSRVFDSGTLAVAISIRASEKRSFSVAAVDAVGNVGPRTRPVVLVPQLVGLTLRQAKRAVNGRKFVIRWARSASAKPLPLPYVVAQSPAAPAIVDEGSCVTVVAGAKPDLPRP